MATGSRWSAPIITTMRRRARMPSWGAILWYTGVLVGLVVVAAIFSLAWQGALMLWELWRWSSRR